MIFLIYNLNMEMLFIKYFLDEIFHFYYKKKVIMSIQLYINFNYI